MAMKLMTEQMIGGNEQIRLPNRPRGITTDEAERLHKIYDRQSDADLIKLHCTCQAVEMQAKAEQLAIEEVLQTRFPGLKMKEQIVTRFGVAERKVSNRYVPDPEKMEELRERLGAEFSEYFTEKTSHTVPRDRIDELVEWLGEEADQFIITKPKFTATRAATDAVVLSTHREHDAIADAIDVFRTEHISVRPPSDEEASG